MSDGRPDEQLQPASETSSAEYPRRKPKRDRLPLYATALFAGGVIAFGASIFCFHYLECWGLGVQPARLSGLTWTPDWPMWAQEEILGVEAVQRDEPSQFWPWVLALPLVVLAGLWLRRALLWFEKSDRLRQQRKRLGPVATSLDHGCDEKRAVLVGTLEVQGEVIERFDDGAQAAITSASTKPRPGIYAGMPAVVSRRAERLVLRVGDERIPIAGDVNLLGGSMEGTDVRSVDRFLPAVQDRLVAANASAMTNLAGAPVSLRSIAPGDRVKVAGALQRAARSDEVSHYRSSALRWQMIDADIEGQHRPIEVVFEGTPRTRLQLTPLLFWTVVSAYLSIFAIIATASPV